MTQDQFLTIGEIVGVHGVQGVVKVRSYAESPGFFEKGRQLLIGQGASEGRWYTVQWGKPHQKGVLVALDGVGDRNSADALRGSLLFVDKAVLPALESDTFYWFQLIGLSVYTTAGEFLGRVSSMMPTGGNDVLVVKNTLKGTRPEILIPMLSHVVISVDLEGKTIQVELPEGL